MTKITIQEMNDLIAERVLSRDKDCDTHIKPLEAPQSKDKVISNTKDTKIKKPTQSRLGANKSK